MCKGESLFLVHFAAYLKGNLKSVCCLLSSGVFLLSTLFAATGTGRSEKMYHDYKSHLFHGHRYIFIALSMAKENWFYLHH